MFGSKNPDEEFFKNAILRYRLIDAEVFDCDKNYENLVDKMEGIEVHKEYDGKVLFHGHPKIYEAGAVGDSSYLGYIGAAITVVEAPLEVTYKHGLIKPVPKMGIRYSGYSYEIYRQNKPKPTKYNLTPVIEDMYFEPGYSYSRHGTWTALSRNTAYVKTGDNSATFVYLPEYSVELDMQHLINFPVDAMVTMKKSLI